MQNFQNHGLSSIHREHGNYYDHWVRLGWRKTFKKSLSGHQTVCQTPDSHHHPDPVPWDKNTLD